MSSIFCSKKYLVWPIIWAFFLASPCYAQFDISLNQNIYYDDHIYKNYLDIADMVNQTSLKIGYRHTWLNWHFYPTYNGNVYFFRDESDHTFHVHYTGLTINRMFGANRNYFNMGFNFSKRYNKNTFNLYDLNDMNGYANIQSKIVLGFLMNIGYNFQDRHFINLSQYSYVEHSAFLRLSKFLPTKTTIIFETDFGYKKYSGKTTITKIQETIYTNDPVSSKGKGRGYGYGRGKDSPGNPKQDSTIITSLIYIAEVPFAKQGQTRIRIAQAIGSDAGVGIEFLKRWNPTKNNRYISGQESGYTEDDELFDDVYSFESAEWSAFLSQKMPYTIIFRLGANISLKNYPNIPALNMLGERKLPYSDRKDQKNVYWSSLQKRFLGTYLFKGFVMNLQLEYVSNRSNDPFYQYEGLVFSAGLGLEF